MKTETDSRTAAGQAGPVTTTGAQPLLTVEGLVKAYKGRRVVDGVTIHVVFQSYAENSSVMCSMLPSWKNVAGVPNVPDAFR